MSYSCQEFLATATIKAASELEKAFLSLPEDKRNWKMSESARSAANQVAECAIMNGSTIEMLQSQRFPDDHAQAYYAEEIARLSQDWNALQSLLKTNTESVVEVIRAFSDETLSAELISPWGPMAMTEIVSYPYWNMTYHLGQINYIASVLKGQE